MGAENREPKGVEIDGRKSPRESLQRQPTQERLSSKIIRFSNELRATNQYNDVTFEYAEDVIRELGDIGRIRREGNTIKPEAVSVGLAELTGQLAVYDHSIKSNRIEDPEINKQDEESYAKVREIYMESCRRVFPESQASIHYANLKVLAERLERNITMSISSGVPSLIEQMKMLKEDPRELANIIDDILYITGMAMKSESYKLTGSTDMSLVSDLHKRLAIAAEDMFALQQMKDQLQVIVYERRAADLTPGEANKIDALRNQFTAGKSKGEETMEERKKRLDVLWESSQAKQAPKEEKKDLPPEESPDLRPEALRDKNPNFSKSEIAKILYDPRYTTLEQVKGIVTEDVKRAVLESMLRQIDLGIKSAETALQGRTNAKLNMKSVAKFCGMAVTYNDAPVYQKIAAAAENQVRLPDDLAKMPIVEYLSRYLNYDLKADKRRADLLREYTNAFD